MAGKEYDTREIMFSIELDNVRDMRDFALMVLRTLVLASPVGDPSQWSPATPVPPGYVGGAFRGAWDVTIGQPTDVDPQGRIDASGGQTIARGRGVIRTYRRIRQGPLITQNNKPYGPRLNAGWSRQAPAGFVEEGIQATRRALERRREIN